jgi:hypothetical protein
MTEAHRSGCPTPLGVSHQHAARGLRRQVQPARPPRHTSARLGCSHTLRYCWLGLLVASSVAGTADPTPRFLPASRHPLVTGFMS